MEKLPFQKKEEEGTFRTFSLKKLRRRQFEALKGTSKRTALFSLAIACVVTGTVFGVTYRAVASYLAEQRRVETLQHRRFLSQRYDVLFEDDPTKPTKVVSFFEESRVYFRGQDQAHGYGQLLPGTYTLPDGTGGLLSYRNLDATINGNPAFTELLPRKAGYSFHARNNEEPLRDGENTVKTEYEIANFPLQDRNGNERFQWYFPHGWFTNIDHLELHLVLPSYAEKDTLTLAAALARGEEKTPIPNPNFLLGEQIIQGKTRITVSLSQHHLRDEHRLFVDVGW